MYAIAYMQMSLVVMWHANANFYFQNSSNCE